MKIDIQAPIEINGVKELIPHRHPFLLIDRVVGWEDGKSIEAIKAVSGNEQFFQGHFPDRPLMPGVLILEALAQLGAVFAKLFLMDDPNQLVVFTGAENVRFRRQVVPGDVLTLRAWDVSFRRGHFKLNASAHVGDEIAVSAILKAAAIS